MCNVPKDNSAELARRAEQERQGRIRQGADNINSIFDKTFNDQFFTGARNDALAASLPEIDRQFGNANRKVQLGLESRGIRESDAGVRQMADLFRSYGDARTDAGNRATSFASDLRGKAENQRQQLLAQNLAAADPSQAGSLATAAASAIQPTPPALSFGDLFANAINTAGNAVVYRSLNPNASANPFSFGSNKSARVVSGG